MIKRNMKKWENLVFQECQEDLREDHYEDMDSHVNVFIEAFTSRFKMKNPKVLDHAAIESYIDHEDYEPHYVMVLFMDSLAKLNVFEADGITKKCGTQSGEGKFMVFDSKHSYALTGEDYVVIHFKEQV